MTKANKLPSQEYLKECFTYDPETGLLHWKERPRKHFNTDNLHKSFNSQFAGKQAFTHLNDKGYYRGSINGRKYYAHRIIWKLYYGNDPDLVLHSKGNTKDNRIENLNNGTHCDNSRDRKKQKNNSTGITGVYWDKRAGNWLAVIKGFEGKRIRLGCSSDFFEACCMRKSGEVKFNYHKDHGRR